MVFGMKICGQSQVFNVPILTNRCSFRPHHRPYRKVDNAPRAAQQSSGVCAFHPPVADLPVLLQRSHVQLFADFHIGVHILIKREFDDISYFLSMHKVLISSVLLDHSQHQGINVQSQHFQRAATFIQPSAVIGGRSLAGSR